MGTNQSTWLLPVCGDPNSGSLLHQQTLYPPRHLLSALVLNALRKRYSASYTLASHGCVCSLYRPLQHQLCWGRVDKGRLCALFSSTLGVKNVGKSCSVRNTEAFLCFSLLCPESRVWETAWHTWLYLCTEESLHCFVVS